ncbi:tetratricopeptide repeat protein [Streptomyces sp. N2A]|uniref:tetratricopeptide repeat protein n=1 Tax=Streptomyces sp. N2A TaxID=3073936 RepID=UPI0028701C21|nr:tetratricopeptide repeat protein [Streptomyces sp. N2A]
MNEDVRRLRDIANIRRALADNLDAPNGPARNGRAEELVDRSEGTGDRRLLLDALFGLISGYQFSAESEKMFVPFSRLLRMWDEDPGDFDSYAVHRLHWRFKWVSSGMIDHPGIPLAAIRHWLTEMSHRYRAAGYSLRAVRAAEFRLAEHLGDDALAARLLEEWIAAERDEMSNCHACERNAQGAWYADHGDDERALAFWAPVLNGELSCREEPHRVLSRSLLPLVRLGRYDEARHHHLRGYRMARGNESLLPTIGRHIEFCALTGNEARGLEILAEHTAHLDSDGDLLDRLDLFAPTTLLLRRLVALGHGDRPVPAPGGTTSTTAHLLARTEAAAGSLARRFDERNGTDAVSSQVARRMAGTPLPDRLPLGVRAARLVPRTTVRPEAAAPGPAPVPVPVEAAAAAQAADTVDALLAEARQLTRAQRPDAHAAWRAVAGAAERTGTELDARARAEVTDHLARDAFDDPDTAIPLFRTAAELFEAAGDPGEAALCRVRAASCAAVSGRPVEGLAELDAACGELGALHAERRATDHQLIVARNTAARTRLGALHAAPDPAASAAALEGELRAVLAFAEQHRGEEWMPAGLADATCLLGSVVEGRGDAPQAVELFGRAAELFHEAAVPWYAAEAEAQLAELSFQEGDPRTAEKSARAALEHGGELLNPVGSVRLRLVLAEALAALGGDDAEVAAHALDATHRADEAADSAGLGAWARLVLGGALLRLRRFDEAASVLESALPDLQEHHTEGRIVQARRWLGQCLDALGDAREASEQFLLAADIAKGWDAQRDHAVLAHLAGDALHRAGLHEQATAAYARAEELWRALGQPHSAARAVRARAWLALRDAESGPQGARVLMATAEQLLTGALAATVDDERRTRLRSELAGTHRQTAELLLRARRSGPADADAADDEDDDKNGDKNGDGTVQRAREEALGHLEKAIALYAALGQDGRHDHNSAQLMAGWLEAGLGRRSAAGARARTVLDDDDHEYGDADGAADGGRETVQRHRADARALLDRVG